MTRKTDKIFAGPENSQALKELKSRLLNAFGIEKMILYARLHGQRLTVSPIPIFSSSLISP